MLCRSVEDVTSTALRPFVPHNYAGQPQLRTYSSAADRASTPCRTTRRDEDTRLTVTHVQKRSVTEVLRPDIRPADLLTCGDKFLYGFKGGPAGPPRPPPQVRPARPCRSAPGRPARAGRGLAKGRTEAGRNSTDRWRPSGFASVAAYSGASAVTQLRDVGDQGRRCRCGLLRLRRGHFRLQDGGHPSRLPTTQASRADHHRGRQRLAASCTTRTTVAAPAPARSPEGWVDGRRDGRRTRCARSAR